MNVPEDCTTAVEISASIPSEVLYANVKRVILEAEFIAQVSTYRNEKLRSFSLQHFYEHRIFCLSYEECTQKMDAVKITYCVHFNCLALSLNRMNRQSYGFQGWYYLCTQ